MKFTKMHGIGNDYVYVNGFEEKVEDKSAAAIKVSDRHFGIGSDGLIFINPSDKAPIEMEMYNSDGSRAEMCGNGVRCVAKYAYDNGLVKDTVFDVDTLAGIKKIELTIDEKTGKAALAKVNMGAPVLEPEKVPAKAELFAGYDSGAIVNLPLIVAGKEYKVTCVSMGNPHAIVFIDCDVKDFPLEEIGPLFEKHEAFPRYTNTEFIHVLDENTLQMRVWERGAGETLACGTGACASMVAAYLNGLTGKVVTVKLLGGDLHIEWDGDETHPVYMTGSATTVYTGEIEL